MLTSTRNCSSHDHPRYYKQCSMALSLLLCSLSLCSGVEDVNYGFIDRTSPLLSLEEECPGPLALSDKNNRSDDNSSTFYTVPSTTVLTEMTYEIEKDEDDNNWYGTSKNTSSSSSSSSTTFQFMAYLEPDVSSFYKNVETTTTAKKVSRVYKSSGQFHVETVATAARSQKVVPKYDGKIGKFINLSNQHLQLVVRKRWNGPFQVLREFSPFMATGFTTRPGYIFSFRNNRANNPVTVESFVIQPSNQSSVYIYDPYDDSASLSALFAGETTTTSTNDVSSSNYNQLYKLLKPSDKKLYKQWKESLQFAKQYEEFTGRLYLPNAPRSPSSHFMWDANHFGEEHWVMTRETQFSSLPPIHERLLPMFGSRAKRRYQSDDEERTLEDYRRQATTSKYFNMTLKAVSCRPRIFEIDNFLSPIEVRHILEDLVLPNSHLLERSVLSNNNTHHTRTSTNMWLKRETSPIVDSIYRRAADLLQVDEALLRHRGVDEDSDIPTRSSLAESLEVVHYDVGQHYTPHHDFQYADITNEQQPARFATISIHLNDDMEGGETSFPRYANAETSEDLRIKTQTGKAVLFYNQLPDGNFDDLAHHASLPVEKGEKWVMNLWIWDPIRA